MIIELDDNRLTYSGRIDYSNPKRPNFIYPSSFVEFGFFGTGVKMVLTNNHQFYDNYVGIIVDGIQTKALLKENGTTELLICENLEEKEHKVMLFKRMDACHEFIIESIELLENGKLLDMTNKSFRKIEFYGDSVSAGEVSEAVEYMGKEDPVHNGEYSNSWYSYAWMTARKLEAQIHNIAQGGIALLDKTGWFDAPNYKGMESTWDKLNYNNKLGEITPWEFSGYTPHVVIVAIGQNDNHPEDYMKENMESEKSVYWREQYKKFVLNLRKVYPKAFIILTTTILNHHENWDKSIDRVCKEIEDEKISHFLYSNNGCGTPGHIRIAEAEKMSEELADYIQSIHDVWQVL